MDRPAIIRKSGRDLRGRRFPGAARGRSCADCPGGGINIAHEAVERHARGARRDYAAFRFLGTDARRAITYGELSRLTNRFANVLTALGIAKDDRLFVLAGRQLAAQHSHSLEGWYAHIPGIKVLAPATLGDAPGMLAPALADPDPVIIFEHAQLYNLEGELPDDWRCDISSARLRREGIQVSLIAYGGCLPKALAAAEQLAAEGIEAEVVDLRVLRPLDTAAIAASVRKTHRAVVIDEGWKSGSLSAEVVARIMENAFYELDAPVARVCSEEVPIPYAKHMEEAALPQVPKIVAAAKQVLGKT